MLKWPKKRLGALILISLAGLALQACGPKFKDQPDCGFVQNVYGERISWKGSTPIQLYVHNSFPQNMLPALNKAIETWKDALGYSAFQIIQENYAGDPTPKQD